MISKISKTIFGLFAFTAILVGCQQIRNSGVGELAPIAEDGLRIATINVHYIILSKETGAWSVGDWDRRKAPLDAAFKATGADIITTQESESFERGGDGKTNLTLDWLLRQNPDYAAAAVGDPAEFPSTQPIYYRRARFDVVDQGWFFFSETPDVIYSRTFNGSYPAYATWAQFRDRKSNAAFRVINVHTDFSSASNRKQSIELVVKRATPWIESGENVILAGDLNERHGGKTQTMLADAGFAFAPIKGSTYHFNRGVNLFGAIDHVGFTDGLAVAAPPVVLRQKFLGEWPTDHYPVVVDLEYQN